MTKQNCLKCGVIKPLSDFSKRSATKNGYAYECKECSKKRNEDYRLKNKEKIKKYRAKSKPEKELDWMYSHIKRKYGLTKEEFDNMLDIQNWSCKICGIKLSIKALDRESYDTRKACVVDHCHKTGKVRGLLCTKCNAGLGMFNDSIKSMADAIKYLEENG